MKKQTNNSFCNRITLVLSLVMFHTFTSSAQVRDMYGNAVSSDLCNQIRSFESDEEVERLVTKIMDVYGLPNRFIIGPCPRVPNAVATVDKKGAPAILYNPDFLKKIKGFSFTASDLPTESEDWGVLLVFAHEIGHHLCNHITSPHPDLTQRDMELEADERAGYILYLLNAPDLRTAQFGLRVQQVSEAGTYTHPPRSQRLEAFKKGWDKAAERFPRTGPKPTNKDVENKSQCGAYIAPGKWKVFMCHNLGVANTNADPFTPSWEINGGYWQWGRREMAAEGPSGPASFQANDEAISSWNTSNARDEAWEIKSKTNNVPCPDGFTVPTANQWDGIINNNTVSRLGSWDNIPTNYTSGLKIGEKLMLPAAGARKSSGGELVNRGYFGFYWSSLEDGYADRAYYMYFYDKEEGTSSGGNYYRTSGLSIRCIKK